MPGVMSRFALAARQTAPVFSRAGGAQRQFAPLFSRSFAKPSTMPQAVEARAAQAKEELATLAAAFSRYDGEGKGALNVEDIRKALEDLAMPAGEVDVHQLFEQLDENKDGTIELTEWLDKMPKGAKLRILEKSASDGDYVQFRIPDMKIVYTYTDEAPMLATYSLLPLFRSFCRLGNVKMVKKDISLAARILANFPDSLTPEQRVDDDLDYLGRLATNPAANIIKLPNISASVPQLEAAIHELQEKGFAVPNYPDHPHNAKEADIKARYAKVLGSAVNPVLREGNSDRRVAKPVKEYAKKNPHKVGEWAPTSKSHVAYMTDGDFFGSEQSAIMDSECSVRIELVTEKDTQILKAKTYLLPGEIIDASVMCVSRLRRFYEEQMQTCDKDTLFSLHLKATMMKVSDPVMFGHCVTVFFKKAFEKHKALFAELDIEPTNGLGDVYMKIEGHPKQAEVEADIAACYAERPNLAYVDSRKGITNLHVPSDVIVDASMAAAIRDSGRMWTKEDTLCDAKFVIPDRCYATQYQAIIEDFKANGKLDPRTCGAVSNVGLMAAKAEEYGSHNKTFILEESGTVQVVDRESGNVIFSHKVNEGDIWRMCQTKDIPIQDWVKLAVVRARNSNTPCIFWLTEERAHDKNMISKVNKYLEPLDTSGLDIQILPPCQAMKATLARSRQGLDTISATGNVLRDYLTDMFPILELGTSAKMLSIVPLLAGGGMYETGAGGSAPKHVQQFLKEGHLRWDSLGEFLAMAVSLEDIATKTLNPDARILAETLNNATGKVMNGNKSPKRSVMELDNRGSHYYLALYWAEELSGQTQSPALASRFSKVAAQLKANEAKIVGELIAAEGKPANIGGYYFPDPFLAAQAMRPSPTFNSILDATLASSGW